MKYALPLLGVLALSGCPETTVPTDAGAAADAGASEVDAGYDAGFDAGPPMCGPDERLSRLVYYGTAEPTTMPLTAGQVLAIVDFTTCSGTFVTDEWVLTAEHCGVRVGDELCVGVEAANPNVCFTADRVEDNPDVDMTLVHVDAPASSRLPELEPIPLMVEPLDSSWVGRTAEAAGYGTQEDDSSGEREFTSEPIDEVGVPYLTIDGEGTRGVCFGDSGGPVMVLATDSTVRVAGTLSYGDPSCVGLDNFTRTDLQVTWLETLLGPITADGAPCRTLTVQGDCMGSASAVWCDPATDLVTSETCAGGDACGWSDTDGGYRCVADDPCVGVSAAGECQDGTAVWCEAGTLRSRGCAACGQICRYLSEMGAFYCAPDPCSGIDPRGECDGNTLTTCNSDGIRVRDCAARGRVCSFDDSRGRYRCR